MVFMLTIADVLNKWEAVGVFDFVLPFLLIFAIVFGIMTATNILSGNKAVNTIISLVIGLLALRLSFVQIFFLEVFPRLGVGLVTLLVVLLLVGLFIPTNVRGIVFWILFAIGAVIAIIVLGGTFAATGPLNPTFTNIIGSDILVWVVTVALLIGVIVVIVLGKPQQAQANTALGPAFMVPMRNPE